MLSPNSFGKLAVVTIGVSAFKILNILLRVRLFVCFHYRLYFGNFKKSNLCFTYFKIYFICKI